MPLLNGLDYVLLIVLGFFTITGLMRGLVRQIIDLVAWAGAIYLAITFGARVAGELNRLFDLEVHLSRALGPIWGNFAIGTAAVNVLGFVLVLIAVRLVASIVASFVDILTRLPIVRSLNSLGGAGLGFAKGLVIIFLVATVLRAMPTGAFAAHIDNSTVIDTVLSISPYLYEHLREFILKVRPLV